MASHSQLQEMVREIAAESADVPARTVEVEAVLSILGGSLHALLRALELRYEDRSEETRSSTELYELFNQILAVNHLRDGQWLAGLYFNSALYRLVALYHRSLKLLLNYQTDPSAQHDVSLNKHVAVTGPLQKADLSSY